MVKKTEVVRISLVIFVTLLLVFTIQSFYSDSLIQLSPGASSPHFLYKLGGEQLISGLSGKVSEQDFCMDIGRVGEGSVSFTKFGENFEIYFDSIDEREDGTVEYVGNDGNVIFIQDGNSIVGRITAPGSNFVYSLEYLEQQGGGAFSRFTNRKCSGLPVTTVIKIDTRLLPPFDGDGIPVNEISPQPKGQPEAITAGGTIVPIDILFVYTPAAKVLAGGDAAMELKVQEIILAMNTHHENSDTVTRFRDVHTAKINYVESGSYSTDLNRLRHPGDGHMDTVHSLRNQYGADVVVFIGDIEGACGSAYILDPFSVNDYSCISSAVVSHEVGHNQGMCHVPGDGGGCASGGYYSYSKGHRFNGVSSLQWRTIMGYPPGTRISYFSNPDVFYDGIATGTSGRDNARTADNTAGIVSNWAICSYSCETYAPTNLAASQGLRDHVKVTWENWEDYSYTVYRSAGCSGNIVAENVYGKEFKDYTAEPEISYTYSVRAHSILGDSSCSVLSVTGYSIETNECGEGHQDNGDGTCTAMIYASEGDGYIRSSKDGWDLTHDSSIGDYANNFYLTMDVYSFHSESADIIHRTFIPFDTSLIPNNMDVVSASLNINTSAKGTFGKVIFLESMRENSEILTRDDFGSCGDVLTPVSPSDYFAEVSVSSFLIHQYKTIVLNQNIVDSINRVGITDICVRAKTDADDVPPIASQYYEHVSFTSATSPGPPYLEIVYERNLCEAGEPCDPHNFFVGAKSYDGASGQNRGKIYSYNSSNGGFLWSLEGEGSNDLFGYAIGAVRAGLEKYVLVTAPFYDVHGKVYAFDSATGDFVWSRKGNNNYLGGSVTTISDLNNDGKEDVLVGAWQHPAPTIQNSRRVYALSGANGAILWSTPQVIPDANLFFGKSLAEISDITNDGISDVIVGSPQLGSVAGVRGSVYLLDGSDGSMLQVIEAGNDTEDFGVSVASTQDLNGNGYDEIVIGSGSYDGAVSENVGKVFIYDSNSLELITSFEGNDAYDNFGLQVAIITNSLGKDRLLVSQHSQDNGYTGTIFSYNLETGSLLWQRSGSQGSYLGSTLRAIPDINKDGHEDFIANSGVSPVFFIPTKAHVYDGKTGSLIWNVEGENQDDYFGEALGGN